MAKRRVNIGLIGYQFMGKAHSNAYRQAPRFFDMDWEPVLKCICGRHEGPLREAASRYGFEEIETDWRRLVERKDIDLVDVSTPGNLHASISIAAAEAGKIVWCEKPLANNLDEARAMWEAVLSPPPTPSSVTNQTEEGALFNAIFHNYRFCPAVQLARLMISDGLLGKIYHFRAVYLQDWIASPAFPMVWRLDKEIAGSGALGDIGAHIIDLARFLVGEISSVCGCLETFVHERPIAPPSGSSGNELKMAKVDVDDAALFLARFENGALGSFEASRFAIGRKNKNSFEINGSKGSIVFDLERMNELWFCDAPAPSGSLDLQGFRLIQATGATHPFAGNWWPVGHIIGYEHTFTHLVADGFARMARGRNPSPGFEDGLRNQMVLDAVERSAVSEKWENVLAE